MAATIKTSLITSLALLIGANLAVSAYGDSTLLIEPSSLQTIGLRDVVEQDPNLTGAGVSLAVICRSMTYQNGLAAGDYRPDTSHPSLDGSSIIFEDKSTIQSGVSSHETAVTAVLLGLDPFGFHPRTGPFFYEGACPDAKLEVFEFWRFVSLYVFSAKPFDAEVVTMSLGDVFPGWWTRGIENLVDNKGLVVFAAAGNGNKAYDPILYPAAGANVIAVGVVNAASDPNLFKSLSLFAAPNAAYSSFGPTADSRCKPDIVAPGRCLVPAIGPAKGYEIEGDWSSLAAPIAAGTAAVLIQKAKTDPELTVPIMTTNTNCVVKAILQTSATKLPYWHKGLPGSEDDILVPLDYAQGAGMLNAKQAYRLMLSGWNAPGQVHASGWDNSALDPNTASAQYDFEITDPNSTWITATLCWNRVFQDVYPFDPLYSEDSNLRLELWGMDTDDPNTCTLLDTSDSINDNVEHLYLPVSSQFKRYRLMVRFSVAFAGKQQYALAWAVGPDTAEGNPFWYDFNNDGRVNSADRLIHFLLEVYKEDILKSIAESPEIHLDPERLSVLLAQWPKWKTYLKAWNTDYTTPPASSLHDTIE